ncbi:unnamed protein product [Sphagnum jensenii]|uniref:Exocyst subunit Exo70 family protein n=1 Tax=Sphagnum jensenii TaxID=128206 RepID=A0ABP0WS83_9BRYO
MASPDGEQRVLMTAEHIVRSLGTTDTMTDDMLQILSKFDHRFSIMHDKKKKNAMANESSLDHAEDVIRRWDMRYSEQARQQMIFECPEEEASTYLEAVDEVQKVLDSLSVVQQQQNSRDPETTTTLERAHNLIELAMGRLQEEFRHLLVKNSRSVEPETLFDSLAAGSFQSSLEEGENDAADDAQEDAEARESSGEEDNADEDVLPVARPAPLVQTTMDLVPPDVAIDLASIAQRMIAAKYQSECCMVYVNSRKTALEESLSGLWVEKLSIDEVQRMPWAAQEDKIRKWIQAMKVGVKVLLASEKLLCDQVFPAPVSETCFSDIAKGVMMQLLSFGEAVAISRRSPEKLFKVLDMYETIHDLLPEVESVFSGVFGVTVEASGILMRLGEAARGTFAEFENAIQRDEVRTAVPGGGVHPLTRYVMNYIKLLCEYKDTLEQLFGEKKKDGTELLGTHDGERDFIGDYDSREKKSWLSERIKWVIQVLLNNLDEKSKSYRDSALTYLFLMNNVHYIVQKVKYSDVIQLIGDDWVRKQTGFYRQCATNYQRAAWIKVLSFLKDEGIHNSGSFSSGVSRVVLKDRFKNFNAAFEEAHKVQSTWIVSDTQLRDELRISVAEKLLPAYRAFVGRYGNFLETGRHPDKYIKFSPEDLEIAIGDLFEGSSGSSSFKRRSFTTQ